MSEGEIGMKVNYDHLVEKSYRHIVSVDPGVNLGIFKSTFCKGWAIDEKKIISIKYKEYLQKPTTFYSSSGLLIIEDQYHRSAKEFPRLKKLIEIKGAMKHEALKEEYDIIEVNPKTWQAAIGLRGHYKPQDVHRVSKIYARKVMSIDDKEKLTDHEAAAICMYQVIIDKYRIKDR